MWALFSFLAAALFAISCLYISERIVHQSTPAKVKMLVMLTLPNIGGIPAPADQREYLLAFPRSCGQ